ncbi:MAG: aldo/keto reductase, partial [Pseudomonadota bacterium]
ALKELGDRDGITVSTKSRYRGPAGLMRAAEVIANLEASLRRLRRDTVDVFHVHAVRPADYAYVMDEIAPALVDQKTRGTVRHIGITETPPNDARQVMLTRAVHDDLWEVVMLAFHLMNHGPRRHIFPTTRANRIGTLIMFAVRNVFSRPERLREAMAELAARGAIADRFAQDDSPLDFLVKEAGAENLTELAYRFARHEAGSDVVLFGTGNVDHLRANVAAINGPPLPAPVLEQLDALFGTLCGVGFDLPDHMRKP